MLTIWGRRSSTNVKKVIWLAEELGLAFEQRDAGGKFGIDEAYRRLNPNGLVPTIVDGPVILWESNTILRYLAATRPEAGFWPADPAVRAQAEKWMDWQIAYANIQRPAFVNLVRKRPEERDQIVIDTAVANSMVQLRILEASLADKPRLSGDRIGLGDVAMGPYIHIWFNLDIKRPMMPHLSDWYDRLKARPAYRRQIAKPLE